MKSNNKIRYAFLFLCIVLLSSCGKELTQYESLLSTPVVESYLLAGDSTLTVKVYSVESFDDDNLQHSLGIVGLDVYVNDLLLTATTTKGIYKLSDISNLLEAGNECNLRFGYNNRTISATTHIPSKPTGLSISQTEIERPSWSYSDTIPDVVLTWDNPDNSYYQIYIENLNQSSGSQAPPSMGGGFGKMMMQPIQGDSYTLKMHDISFEGTYRCVLYKITDEYAELYERMSNTDLSNPVSFIENGLGIFTAYNSDTIRYKVIYDE